MNRLERLADFQEVLTNYQVSEASKKILAETKLVLLVAPTGGGRNTIIRELVKTNEYYFIVSDTTRKPRVNNGKLEQNGVEYWFRSEEEILDDLRAGKYLEAEIIHNQQVSGISIREFKKARDTQKIAITDIDIGGIQNVMSANANAKAVLVLPPSFEEWQRRIFARGTMDPKEYERRLETACKIAIAALEQQYFSFVINDTLEHAVGQIQEIVKDPEQEPKSKAHGRQLVEKLYKETQAFLKSSTAS